MERSAERYIMEGGHRLEGKVSIHGAKNSILPILAATVLSENRCVLKNCPQLSDARAAIEILRYLGCDAVQQQDSITVEAAGMNRCDIPDGLMREMRSSIVFLGAIIARCGRARLSFPGGCELGPRPIDIHLAALRKMKVEISERGGILECEAPKGICGADITLSFPSVGATENIMLAGCTARGITTITNAAREPEIADLAGFLNGCGAKISGAGESIIRIEGVERLKGCEYTVMPDRIETVTYMAAAAVTGGCLELSGVAPQHITAVLPIFEEAGCITKIHNGKLTIAAEGRLRALHPIRTMPYPGFPTDAQAPMMTVAAAAAGTSIFIETIFENRYRHVVELLRLGARIRTEGRVAIVEGVERLEGAQVCCTDLRGGAAIAIAALAAKGKSELQEIRHIERGYEKFDENLERVGARIKRVCDR